MRLTETRHTRTLELHYTALGIFIENARKDPPWYLDGKLIKVSSWLLVTVAD